MPESPLSSSFGSASDSKMTLLMNSPQLCYLPSEVTVVRQGSQVVVPSPSERLSSGCRESHVFIMVSSMVADLSEHLFICNMECVPFSVYALLNSVLHLFLKSFQYYQIHSYKKVVLGRVLRRPHGGRQMFLPDPSGDHSR